MKTLAYIQSATSRYVFPVAICLLVLVQCTTAAVAEETDGYISELTPEMADMVRRAPESIRIATYNCSMNRTSEGKLHTDLGGKDRQVTRVASIIRIVRPDIILLNEIDFDADHDNATDFAKSYLQSDDESYVAPPIEYPYIYSAEVNTGVPSGLDLNGNGSTTDPEDAWGYGRFPGHYGMAVLSKFPIDVKATRTFQKFLWNDLPDARRPIEPSTGQPYYNDEVWSKLRLSSKSFWDVVISLPDQRSPLHLIASHPTPPVFDGPADHNGCRNNDEIRLITEYIKSAASNFLVDDQGRVGGLPADATFVVVGDLNADPVDGDGIHSGIQSLLDLPRVQGAEAPKSAGAVEATTKQKYKNSEHKGDSAADTGDFNDRSVGNLRIDYVLPSDDLKVQKRAVFWPSYDGLEGMDAKLLDASDHRMVYIDVK